jgi:hypothetical protein
MIVGAVTGTETATVSNNINFGSARGTVISVGSSTAGFGPTIALTGVISGTGGFGNNGGGDVMLGAANTYTGPTIIGTGRVFITSNIGSLGAASSLGADTSAIRLVGSVDGPTDPNSGRFGTVNAQLVNGTTGTLTIDRPLVIDGQQAEFNDAEGAILQGNPAGGASAGAFVFNGTVAINNSKLIVRSDGTTVFNGVISGNGVFRDAGSGGAGTIVLNAANTYSGGTEVGVLGASPTQRVGYRLGNNAALGTGDVWIIAAARRPNFFADGGARTIANNFKGFGGFDVRGTNPMTFTGNMDLDGQNSTFVILGSAGAATFSGNLTHLGLIKGIDTGVTTTAAPADTGNGTLILTGNNTGLEAIVQIGQTSGSAAFSAGVLQATNSTSLGPGGQVNNNTTVVTRSTLELNALGPNINLTDFVSANGTGSANLGAIHNKAGNNSFNGANLNLVRFATTPAESANNTSIGVDAGTQLSFVGTGSTQVNGAINDVSGAGVASINSQSQASWTPATRTAGTATFNKEGGGTLTVARISNLQITTEATAPTTGQFRHQFIDRVPFQTLNVNNGTMVIAAGRNISTSHIVQDTAPPTTVTGLTTGPFLATPSTNKTTFVKNLNIAAGATLDLNDNDMVVDYTGATTYGTIKSKIVSAYSGNTWTGTGITSGVVRSQAGSAHETGLGYAEASAVLGSNPGSYSGVDGIDNTAVIVRYTWKGDANLDGAVDTVDFNILAANFAGGVGDWNQADFNYDGFVDTVDLGFIAQNFPQPPIAASAAGSSVASGMNPASIGALVPEPTSLGLVGLAAAGLMARRRRRN